MTGPDEPPACGHDFLVKTWTASTDNWVDAKLGPDNLSPWSPARVQTEESDQEVVVVYAGAEEVKNCPTCKLHFCTTFEMPSFWWQDNTKRSNGYFGCESRRDDYGCMTGYNTWCHFIVKMLTSKDDYKWAKFNIFTQWRAATQQTAIVVFDHSRNYTVDLSFATRPFYGPAQRGRGVSEKCSPLWPYTRILDQVSTLQNKSVWDIRTMVRNVEKKREVKKEAKEDKENEKQGDQQQNEVEEDKKKKEKKKPVIDYPGLHDLARHAIHACETLDVSVRTARTILDHHRQFMDELRLTDTTAASASSWGAARNVHETLQHMEHMIDSLRHRSSSNRARLLNEIQLCYHMSSDYDSGTSVQIAAATRSDSADMRTVAYLTLTFLPATFISALFGTSFFSFEQDTGTWAVAQEFWLFWVITIPATAVTIGVWYFWKNGADSLSLGPPAVSRRATDVRGTGGGGWEVRRRLRGVMGDLEKPVAKEVV